jgi:hypothetical protein
MKIFFFSLLLGLMITAPTIAQEVESDFGQQVKNDLEIKDVRFERCEKSKDWCLVLDTKGKYERMDYPQLRFFINNELVAETAQLYGIVIEDGYYIETNLKEIPKDFELLIVVTTLNRRNGDCIVYQTKANKTKTPKK